MPWQTHDEHIKEQMANPEYAAAYAEMKAELDREFQLAQEDENQPFVATPSSALPAKANTARNGASRRSGTEKTARASSQK